MAPEAAVVEVPTLVVLPELDPAVVVGGTAVAEPAGTDGTVEGWPAVFQVAADGHAVAATVGEVVPKGVGPGTKSRYSDL